MKSNAKLMAWVLVLATFSFSCGSDDVGIDPNLFGTWTLTANALRDCANPNDNAATAITCDTQTCEKLILTMDNRYQRIVTERGQDRTEAGQIQVTLTQINFLPDNSTASEVLDYVVSGDLLILSNVTLVCTEDLRFNR